MQDVSKRNGNGNDMDNFVLSTQFFCKPKTAEKIKVQSFKKMHKEVTNLYLKKQSHTSFQNNFQCIKDLNVKNRSHERI